MTLDALKAFESELRKRGRLPSEGFYPLWFHAETERNIVLWRRGLSLIHLDEFEFWVDVERLIEKRLRRLDRPLDDNPLSNPLWGEAFLTEEASFAEREYLLELQCSSAALRAHIHALSMVESLLLDEARPECGEREIVILPESSPRPPRPS